jgi:ubiquinone/menaquinone biosynthesis C-methylase UbiE
MLQVIPHERTGMDKSRIRGAVIPPLEHVTADSFDRAHGVTAQGGLMAQLAKEAYGAEYPDGVDPWGMTTKSTLHTYMRVLGLGPQTQLVDIACGRAGVSLWLARESGASLTGVDFSPVAVASAARRSQEWVPPGRARFVVGDLVDTGLPPGSADAVLCADAIFFATDRVAAVAEAGRILRAGGHYAFTADESPADRPTAVPDWAPIIEAGGLDVMERIEIPRWREQMTRLYEVWMEHLDEVREVLGDESADDLREEAESVAPTLADRTGVLYVARKPQ